MSIQENGKFIFIIPCWREKGKFREACGEGELFEEWWLEPTILTLFCRLLLGHGAWLEEEVAGTRPTPLAATTWCNSGCWWSQDQPNT